jgi:hypothetical protein
MTDTEFFAQIVSPTVAEFSRHRGDIRLGVLACLVLQAMNEHYFRHNVTDPDKVYGCTKGDAFKKALRETDWSFGQIMDIANGTKHADKRFFDLHLQRPGVCGIARCGFPMSSANHVFIDDDNAWLLYQLTEHVVEVWRERLS